MTFEDQFGENVENLEKFFRSSNLAPHKITKISCSAGSNPGDNYMSVVKRVHLSGDDGKGKGKLTKHTPLT